jgi:hypothetical protein
LAARDLLLGIRRNGKVLAALPHSVYLEFADVVPEPWVIAVSPADAIGLPNAVVTGPWESRPPAPQGGPAECWAGGSRVMACGLDISAPGGRPRLGAGGRLPCGAAFVRILTP